MAESSGQKNVEFFPSGSIKSYQTLISEEYLISGKAIRVAEDTEVSFYENGNIRSLVLAEDTKLQSGFFAKPFKAGDKILFEHDGDLDSTRVEVNFEDTQEFLQIEDPESLGDQDLSISHQYPLTPPRAPGAALTPPKRIFFGGFFNDSAADEMADGEIKIYSQPEVPNLLSSQVNYMIANRPEVAGPKIIIFDHQKSFTTHIRDISFSGAQVVDLLPGRLLGKTFEVLFLDPNGDRTKNLLIRAKLDLSEKLHYNIVFCDLKKNELAHLQSFFMLDEISI